MNRTLAVVLAGGSGSRLHGLTRWEAKPALPVAGCYRNIDFSLSNCVNSGIRQIGILTQYKSHTLIKHLSNAWNFLHSDLGEFIEVWPAQQRDKFEWYRGTADAVFQNLDVIAEHAPEFIVVLAGDHVYKMDYAPMLMQHIKTGADVTVGCVDVPKAQANQFGVMNIADNRRITEFAEKPSVPEMFSRGGVSATVSMGIYVFSTSYLRQRLINDAVAKESTHDFGRDLIPAIVEEGGAFAYSFRGLDSQDQGYWRDVGTLDAYWRTNMDLIDHPTLLGLYDASWPVRTFREQLPPSRFIHHASDAPGVALDSIVSNGCVVDGASIVHSLLFAGVQVGAKSLVIDSLILPNVRIGDGCRLHKVIVPSGMMVPDGTVIGEDLDADRRFYRVSDQGVVLFCDDVNDVQLQPLRGERLGGGVKSMAQVSLGQP